VIEAVDPERGLLRILGPLEVWAGQDWTAVGAPKWRALLAALLLSPGRLVSTDQLIDDLWGEDPPAKASNLVSVYVHHLRKLIGDTRGQLLVTRPPGYQLVLAPGDLDADRFTQLTTDGRAALAAGDHEHAASLLAAALGLWRGRALADVPPTPLVSAEGDRLEWARLQALELRIEADLRCGRQAEVTPELRRLLADHPLREGLWALLMRALSGAGRQAEALEAYGAAREAIANELGVDPGTELQQLYQQILNADAASPAAVGPPARPGPAAATAAGPPAQLPADIADFTGRADEVAEICGLLAGENLASSGPEGDQRAGPGLAGASPAGSPGAVPVVLVVGSGGLGKTALAVHAAHLLADRFSDGQLYVNLRGSTEPLAPAEVLAGCLRELGADAARIGVGEEERAAQFRTRLAGRRVLIVLDDARDAAQVRLLLPGSASCAVLITARRAMPELVGSRLLDLDVLPPAAARALFGKVAGEGRASAEPEATASVLAACAGLPLAIRIAGARLAGRGGWTVRVLADRLSDERHRLDELRAGNLAVRASFEVSFAGLPRPAGAEGTDPARAFRLLGLWTGPSLTLPAAAALIGQPGPGVAEALEVLVDAHLLVTPEPDVYRFHDLLRVYAADRAQAGESEPDRLAAVTRLLTWYLHTTESAARVISPQHHRLPLEPYQLPVQPLEFQTLDEALAWSERERPGLVAATRLAAESGQHDMAWKLAAAAISFFFRRSYWADWVTTHEIGLASARQLGDAEAEAWMLNNLGIALGQQRLPEAVSYFEQAQALYRDMGDTTGEGRAATNLANAYFDLGRFDEALTMAEAALVVQQRAGQRYGEGIALGIIGGACQAMGRFDEAVMRLDEALAIFRGLDDPDSEADALGDLGDALLSLDRADDAVQCYQESLGIRREIGDRHGQAVTLRRLGRARQQAGELGEARRLLTEAWRLFEEVGDSAQAAELRLSLAAPAAEGAADRGTSPAG
jgi:DNA-binding SARP family transcriptional activator